MHYSKIGDFILCKEFRRPFILHAEPRHADVIWARALQLIVLHPPFIHLHSLQELLTKDGTRSQKSRSWMAPNTASEVQVQHLNITWRNCLITRRSIDGRARWAVRHWFASMSSWTWEPSMTSKFKALIKFSSPNLSTATFNIKRQLEFNRCR